MADRITELQRELLAICRGSYAYETWARVTEQPINERTDYRSRLTGQGRVDEIRCELHALNPNAALYFGWGPSEPCIGVAKPKSGGGRSMRTPYSLRSALDMYKFEGAQYHEAMVCLQQAISLSAHMSGKEQASVMTENNKAASIALLERVGHAITALNARVTELAVRDALKALRTGDPVQYIGCAQLLLTVSQTLSRELETRKIFALDPVREHYYESDVPLFGRNVMNKFPGIAYEIDQAGKCYACDLTTASVFHSIRCLEAGVRALARCLGIPDPIKGSDRNWSNIRRDISAAIEAKWPASTGRMSGDAQLFDEILGSLAAINNPYRNGTMHLDSKYTAPEAYHLFEMVKGLMTKIASRMDESGEPKAP